MVRTLPLDSENRPELSRILAIAAAITVHAFAFLLLLIPLATPPMQEAVQPDRPDVVLIKREKKETLPIETEIKPKPVAQQPRAAKQTPTLLPRVEPEVVVDGGTIASDSPTSPETGPTIETGVVATGPVSVSSLAYIRAVAPDYPRDAARIGAQGTVLLKVLVDTDGKPLEVVVQKSSGNKSLDRGAREQVLKHWLFQPAIRDGIAVQAYGMVPVVFSMQ